LGQFLTQFLKLHPVPNVITREYALKKKKETTRKGGLKVDD